MTVWIGKITRMLLLEISKIQFFLFIFSSSGLLKILQLNNMRKLGTSSIASGGSEEEPRGERSRGNRR